MKIAKYFWGLNKKALKETKIILKNPAHPRFISRMATLLARCEEPRDVFSILPKKKFIDAWPKIRRHWAKITRVSDFRDWWETVYEGLLDEKKGKVKKPAGMPAEVFINIGKVVKSARIKQGLSQKDLAIKTGMKQPDISKIEEGRKNITIATLKRLAKILNIKKVEL